MISSILQCEIQTRCKIPFYSSRLSAGFPSPADDYLEKRLDLNEHLIKHPAATFFVKVKGDSMVNAGIFNGDTLIVDRSIEAIHNKVIVAIFNGEFTVKRLRKFKNKTILFAENPDYPHFEVTDETDFEVWGVVVHVIHSV